MSTNLPSPFPTLDWKRRFAHRQEAEAKAAAERDAAVAAKSERLQRARKDAYAARASAQAAYNEQHRARLQFDRAVDEQIQQAQAGITNAVHVRDLDSAVGAAIKFMALERIRAVKVAEKPSGLAGFQL